LRLNFIQSSYFSGSLPEEHAQSDSNDQSYATGSAFFIEHVSHSLRGGTWGWNRRHDRRRGWNWERRGNWDRIRGGNGVGDWNRVGNWRWWGVGNWSGRNSAGSGRVRGTGDVGPYDSDIQNGEQSKMIGQTTHFAVLNRRVLIRALPEAFFIDEGKARALRRVLSVHRNADLHRLGGLLGSSLGVRSRHTDNFALSRYRLGFLRNANLFRLNCGDRQCGVFTESGRRHRDLNILLSDGGFLSRGDLRGDLVGRSGAFSLSKNGASGGASQTESGRPRTSRAVWTARLASLRIRIGIGACRASLNTSIIIQEETRA